MTVLRRLFWLALVAAVVMAAKWAYDQRADEETPSEPEWPPLDPPVTPASAAETPSAEAAATDQPSANWVEPVDGACPDGYPVKVNVKSGIFHVPGGRFYDRTVPQRCYADAAQAEADGYRRAKA